MLPRLLLLPLLLPLLASLAVAALNPRPAISLRLLTWRSPSLPLGVWIAAAALAGTGLSAGSTALALGQAGPGLRRRVRRAGPEAAWSDPAPRRAAESPRRGGGDSAAQGGGRPPRSDRDREAPPAAWAGPDRAPGEPPPTVSVPFRVVRRGAAAAGVPEGGPARHAADVPAGAAAGGDSWDDGADDEDW